MEFQMTIRTKVAKLTTKQASILLMVLVVKSLKEGIDVTSYLGMEYLYTVLVRSGHDPVDLMDEKIRKTVLVSETILAWVRGEWLNLSDKEQVPNDVRETIEATHWLPNERTYSSWRYFWEPTKWLEVRIVPLDTFDKRASDTERYSGYTKGYGNDGSPESPQKTRATAELDGDLGYNPQPSYDLLEMEMYQNLLLEIERAKSGKRRK